MQTKFWLLTFVISYGLLHGRKVEREVDLYGKSNEEVFEDFEDDVLGKEFNERNTDETSSSPEMSVTFESRFPDIINLYWVNDNVRFAILFY